MTRRTSLYDEHVNAGAKMVPFAGWEMPLHYGSQIAEHNAVRLDSGMFDVSHMTVIDVGGSGATSYLRRLLANDVGRLDEPGKAAYGVMLNNGGGIIDDLMVTRRPGHLFLVVNAGRTDIDYGHILGGIGGDAELTPLDGRALLALQGPRSPDVLGRFAAAAATSL